MMKSFWKLYSKISPVYDCIKQKDNTLKEDFIQQLEFTCYNIKHAEEIKFEGYISQSLKQNSYCDGAFSSTELHLLVLSSQKQLCNVTTDIDLLFVCIALDPLSSSEEFHVNCPWVSLNLSL